MNKKALLVLINSLGLAACVSNPDVGTLLSSQRSAYSSMKVYEDPIFQPHVILGQVKGLSCHRNAYKSQMLTSDEAIEGVKLRAALLGANAVANMVCQKNSGTDWVNNCWASIVCIGDAVKYK